MRVFCLALFLPLVASAAMLPEKIGAYQRGAISKPALSDRPVWDEFGLKNWESAVYESGKTKFTATVWQLQDSTGALAAFDWQRPADATASDLAKLAAQTPKSLLLAHGNYLLSFAGYQPPKEDVDAVRGALVQVDGTVLPPLASYLPVDGLVPNSERYILGPVSLQKVYPVVPPSVAAFHFGTEGQSGVFHNPKGDMTAIIFNYPTNQIAQQRVPEFEKLPGAIVKRSGPLVVVTVAPPDPDFAEHVLGQVRYQAAITVSEYVPTKHDNIGYIVLSAFLLIGILVAFALVSGVAWGTWKTVVRRGRKGEDPDALTTLHLRN
jgi:hypothetical protein